MDTNNISCFLLLPILLSCWIGITLSQIAQPVPGVGYGVIQVVGAFTRKLSAGAEGVRLGVKDINDYNAANNIPLRVHLVEGEETLCDVSNTIPVVRNLMTTLAPVSPVPPIIVAGCHQDCLLIAYEISPDHSALTLCYGTSIQPMDYIGANSGGRNLPRTSVDSTPVAVSGLYFLQPSIQSIMYALLKFVRQFGWQKVAVVSHDFDANQFGELADRCAVVLSAHGVQVRRFGGYYGQRNTDWLADLKSGFFRIILVFEEDNVAREILCQIYRQKLHNPAEYVWFFVGQKERNWPEKSNLAPDGMDLTHTPDGINHSYCKPEQLIVAAEGHFTVSPAIWNPNERVPTLSTKSTRSFRRQLLSVLGQTGEHVKSDFNEGSLAYDSVWAGYAAMAASHFACLQDGIPCSFQFDDSLNGLWFPGVSGNVSFHQWRRSIRDANVQIEQYKGKRFERIAWHFNRNNSFLLLNPSPFGKVTPGDGFGLEEFIPPNPGSVSGLPPKNSVESRTDSTSTFTLITTVVSLYSQVLHQR